MRSEEKKMEDVNTKCLKADLSYLENRYNFLLRSRETLLDALHCLFDTITLLPVCKQEYKGAGDRFSKYSGSYEIFKEVREVMEYFGVELSVYNRNIGEGL